MKAETMPRRLPPVRGPALRSAAFAIAMVLAVQLRAQDTAAPAGKGAEAEHAERAADVFRRLQEIENNTVEEPLSAELRANIINKPQIAEETYDRALGLREKGNPHIARGILIGKIEEDLSRSRIDSETLRRERISVIERREDPVRLLARSRKAAAKGARVNPQAAPASRPPKVESGGVSNTFRLAMLGGAALLVGFGVWLWRRKRQ